MRCLSLKNLLVLTTTVWHVSLGLKDILEEFRPGDVNSNELNSFFEDVMKFKKAFKMIRRAAAARKETDVSSNLKKHKENSDIEDYVYDDITFGSNDKKTHQLKNSKNDAISHVRPSNDVYPHIYKEHNDRNGDFVDRYMENLNFDKGERYRRDLDEDVQVEPKSTNGNIEVIGEKGIKSDEESKPLNAHEAIITIFSEIGESTPAVLNALNTEPTRRTKLDKTPTTSKIDEKKSKQVEKRDLKVDIIKDGKLVKEFSSLDNNENNDQIFSESTISNDINPSEIENSNSFENDLNTMVPDTFETVKSIEVPIDSEFIQNDFVQDIPAFVDSVIDEIQENRNSYSKKRSLPSNCKGYHYVPYNFIPQNMFPNYNKQFRKSPPYNDELMYGNYKSANNKRMRRDSLNPLQRPYHSRGLKGFMNTTVKCKRSIQELLGMDNEDDYSEDLDFKAETPTSDKIQVDEQPHETSSKIDTEGSTTTRTLVHKKKTHRAKRFDSLKQQKLLKRLQLHSEPNSENTIPNFYSNNQLGAGRNYNQNIRQNLNFRRDFQTQNLENAYRALQYHYPIYIRTNPYQFPQETNDNFENSRLVYIRKKREECNCTDESRNETHKISKRDLLDFDKEFDKDSDEDLVQKRTESDYADEPDLSEAEHFKKHTKLKKHNRKVAPCRNFEDDYEYEEVPTRKSSYAKSKRKHFPRRCRKKKKKMKLKKKKSNSNSFSAKWERLKDHLFSNDEQNNPLFKSGKNKRSDPQPEAPQKNPQSDGMSNDPNFDYPDIAFDKQKVCPCPFPPPCMPCPMPDDDSFPCPSCPTCPPDSIPSPCEPPCPPPCYPPCPCEPPFPPPCPCEPPFPPPCPCEPPCPSPCPIPFPEPCEPCETCPHPEHTPCPNPPLTSNENINLDMKEGEHNPLHKEAEQMNDYDNVGDNFGTDHEMDERCTYLYVPICLNEAEAEARTTEKPPEPCQIPCPVQIPFLMPVPNNCPRACEESRGAKSVDEEVEDGRNGEPSQFHDHSDYTSNSAPHPSWNPVSNPYLRCPNPHVDSGSSEREKRSCGVAPFVVYIPSVTRPGSREKSEVCYCPDMVLASSPCCSLPCSKSETSEEPESEFLGDQVPNARQIPQIVPYPVPFPCPCPCPINTNNDGDDDDSDDGEYEEEDKDKEKEKCDSHTLDKRSAEFGTDQGNSPCMSFYACPIMYDMGGSVQSNPPLSPVSESQLCPDEPQPLPNEPEPCPNEPEPNPNEPEPNPNEPEPILGAPQPNPILKELQSNSNDSEPCSNPIEPIPYPSPGLSSVPGLDVLSQKLQPTFERPVFGGAKFPNNLNSDGSSIPNLNDPFKRNMKNGQNFRLMFDPRHPAMCRPHFESNSNFAQGTPYSNTESRQGFNNLLYVFPHPDYKVPNFVNKRSRFCPHPHFEAQFPNQFSGVDSFANQQPLRRQNFYETLVNIPNSNFRQFQRSNEPYQQRNLDEMNPQNFRRYISRLKRSFDKNEEPDKMNTETRNSGNCLNCCPRPSCPHLPSYCFYPNFIPTSNNEAESSESEEVNRQSEEGENEPPILPRKQCSYPCLFPLPLTYIRMVRCPLHSPNKESDSVQTSTESCVSSSESPSPDLAEDDSKVKEETKRSWCCPKPDDSIPPSASSDSTTEKTLPVDDTLNDFIAEKMKKVNEYIKNKFLSGCYSMHNLSGRKSSGDSATKNSRTTEDNVKNENSVESSENHADEDQNVSPTRRRLESIEFPFEADVEKSNREARRAHGTPRKFPNKKSNENVEVNKEPTKTTRVIENESVSPNKEEKNKVLGKEETRHRRGCCNPLSRKDKDDKELEPEDFMISRKKSRSEYQDLHFAKEIIETVMKKVDKTPNLRMRIGNALNKKRIYETENVQTQKDTTKEQSFDQRAEYEEAKHLLKTVSCVLNKLVQKQIEQKLCEHLPSHLKNFLKRIVRPPKHKICERHDSKYHEDTFLFRASCPPQKLDPDTRSHLEMGLVKLLDKYNQLDEDARKRAAPIEGYISNHLDLLRKIDENPNNNNNVEVPAIGPEEFGEEEHPLHLNTRNSGENRDSKALTANGDVLDAIDNFNPSKLGEEDNIADSKLKKRDLKEDATEKNVGVPSDKYNKLLKAVEKVRIKRKNEEKIGETFGKKKINELDPDLKDQDEQLSFEAPLVFSP